MKSLQKTFAVSAASLLFSTLSWSAHAVCAAHDLHVGVSGLSYVGPADATAIGKQIGTGWGGTAESAMVLDVSTCSAFFAYAEPADTPIPGITYSDGTTTYPVYPSGVAGIGYVLGLRDKWATKWIAIQPPNAQTFPAPGTQTTAQTSLGWWVRILFVATGQLKTGSYSIPSRRLARVWGTNSSKVQNSPNAFLVFDGTSISVTAKSCTMTSAHDMTVDLPKVNNLDFTGVGSSPAASASFDIALNCQAGVAAYATMTDANAPASTGTTLALAGTSTATGAGVRLFRNGLPTPVAYGPDSSKAGNTNQWLIGGGAAAGAASYSIPFVARYVQTAAAVTPGRVEAAATITLSYQ